MNKQQTGTMQPKTMPMQMPDPLKHFRNDHPFVKLLALALWLVAAVLILTRTDPLPWLGRIAGWW